MSEIEILHFDSTHLEQLIKIWNSIVAQGETFPQKEPLDMEEGLSFFSNQTFAGVAVKDHRIFGFYILHPNNIGRCSKIANASYGVTEAADVAPIVGKMFKNCKCQLRCNRSCPGTRNREKTGPPSP